MLEVALCQHCKSEIEWDVQMCRHCGGWVGEQPATADGHAVARYVPHRDFELARRASILGWCGTAALAGGVFLPFVSMPIVGGISYWSVRGDGVLVVAAALVAMLAHWRQWRPLMILGVGSATGVVCYDTFRLVTQITGPSSGMFGLGLGVILMLVGGVAAVIAAFGMDH